MAALFVVGGLLMKKAASLLYVVTPHLLRMTIAVLDLHMNQKPAARKGVAPNPWPGRITQGLDLILTVWPLVTWKSRSHPAPKE
jgi:hypothetical protein